VLGRVALETASGLLQLALAADLVFSSGLVPRDGDVDEPLVEVALLGRCGAPRVLELLMGGEELAAADQVEAAREPSLELVRGRP